MQASAGGCCEVSGQVITISRRLYRNCLVSAILSCAHSAFCSWSIVLFCLPASPAACLNQPDRDRDRSPLLLPALGLILGGLALLLWPVHIHLCSFDPSHIF
ncbi:hypothetical protein PYCCODRAFT_426447 [Trametes coccinea BRFM310]|uniref:Uncharacterized protein n=1 Tax=Trametes coccinea (strain BRFM310) TaxID=1353009 RepID=A0A1Y2IME5_TRAC3|nr:hypothetical protein PYCCODRAFT_426447 [Trametes coccinea BRFM310]